jgi:transposase
MRDVGVDLHTNSFTACFRSKEGKTQVETYSLKEIKVFLKRLTKEDRVAVEATGNTRYFVEAIKKAVKEVIVIDPNKFNIIKTSVNKTDENDAKNIALFLSKDMLPTARTKTQTQAQLSSMVATRDKFVKLRTVLINKIHNILNSRGIKSKKEAYSSEVGLKRVLEYDIDETAKFELEIIRNQIISLNESIKKLNKKIEEISSNIKGHSNLTSIKGIGAKSASILLSVIGNVKDFETEDKLSAYFGIVPRVSSSNQITHHGRITKRGSKIGRTTLVQCSLIALKYSPYLQKFYYRIKNKKGSGKAIIALARKLLGIIYKTLINNWTFIDFPNFKYVTN